MTIPTITSTNVDGPNEKASLDKDLSGARYLSTAMGCLCGKFTQPKCNLDFFGGKEYLSPPAHSQKYNFIRR